MKFTIISGNDDGIFELNETSGDLFTAKSLDYDEEPNSYKVKEFKVEQLLPPTTSGNPYFKSD